MTEKIAIQCLPDNRDQHSVVDAQRRQVLKSTALLTLSGFVPVQFAHSAMTSKAAAAPTSTLTWPVRPLLKADLTHSLDFKCLSKAVHEVLLLDDMEQPAKWIASAAVQMEYTTDRARQGTRSLRFTTHARSEGHVKASRSPNGSFTGEGVLFDVPPHAASLRRIFTEPQDWSRFNRISLWCYVHPTDISILSLSLQFLCEGASAGPIDPVAIHYIGDLVPGQWNHLIWEIPEMQRDRVRELMIFQPLSGTPFKDIDDTLTYDFDQLQLERVDAEVVEGWTVTPGKIAFSHVGYQPAAPKQAVCSEFASNEFSLLDAISGKVIATLPTTTVNTQRGKFQLLDFSTFNATGNYRLRCGHALSDPFPIADNIWHQVISHTLNAFYGLRCGFAIAGMHDACHCDAFVTYRGEKRVVGGGWHDAANMTQGAGRTHLSIYSLLELHEQMRQDPTATELADRTLEEARWGLEWAVRMRFGKGLRCTYGHYAYYTDGVVGNEDDMLQDNVVVDPFQNILATLAFARAARAFKSIDAPYSVRLLKAAEEDFASVIETYPQPSTDATPIQINEGSWRDRIGYLTLCAAQLYRVTGKRYYADEAARLGRWLLDVQERRFVDGIPVTGYFYEDAGRTRIVHEYHNSFEECGPQALQALCDILPQHPDWIQWYAASLIYSEYFCRIGATAAQPFNVLPSAVWRRQDIDAPTPIDRTGMRMAAFSTPMFPTPPTEALTRTHMMKMFDEGVYLGENHRLRVFPLWYDHIRHGATTVHLSKTAGLIATAQLRNRPELMQLAAQQLQWVLGANPFSRSLMYGTGYDYRQNFTVSLPNLVGGLSLGFNSFHGDAPAWPNNAVFPYKEMWVFSSCRVALNLAHIGMPARLQGSAASNVELQAMATGQRVKIARGRFDLQLAAGEYVARYSGVEERIVLADGTRHRRSFNAAQRIDINWSAQPMDNTVELTVQLRGAGKHALELRLYNATAASTPKEVNLHSGSTETLTWQLHVTDSSMPWVAVLIPDGNHEQRKELFGPLRSLNA